MKVWLELIEISIFTVVVEVIWHSYIPVTYI